MADSTGSRFHAALRLIETATSDHADALVNDLERELGFDLAAVSDEKLVRAVKLSLDLAQTAATLLQKELGSGADFAAYFKKQHDHTTLTEMERDIRGDEPT